MTDVVATDVGSGRRLLAATVAVSFTLVMPTPPGSDPSATFDAVVNDLSAAASAGGALETNGDLASLALSEPTITFVPPSWPDDMTTAKGHDSCVGPNVIFDAQAYECRCKDFGPEGRAD